MTATATAPIRTPFGEFSTADEVADGIDLAGRRAVVTGASSGIGVEMARTLAAGDAQVTLAVRNTDAGEQVAADIRTTAPEARLDVRPLELGDRASVNAFGASTSVLLAVSPLLEGIGGRYFEDCHEASVLRGRSESDGRHGVAAYALDPDNAARLWTVSERLIGRS